jgi:hypothetical protein
MKYFFLVACLALQAGITKAQTGETELSSRYITLAATEKVTIEEKIKTSDLPVKALVNVSSSYPRYEIIKSFRKYSPKGEISYEVVVADKGDVRNLLYSSEGQFAGESDELSEVVRCLLALAFRENK